MIRYPAQINNSSQIAKGWLQTNRSDVIGSLFGSFNIDLNINIPKIRATRMLQTTTQGTAYASTTDASLSSYPVGFKLFSNLVYTVAGSRVHKTGSNSITSGFSIEDSTGSPGKLGADVPDSTLSDIEIFNGSVCVTSNGKLFYQSSAGSSWTSVTLPNSVSGAGPWPLCVYKGRLYIGISGLGYVYSTADLSTIAKPTDQFSCNFISSDYRITFIRASSNRIWIGTVTTIGKGKIYEWDGSTNNFTKEYKLESNGALACVIKNDIPWVMDTNGRLLKYEDGTFVEPNNYARLPINLKYLTKPTSTVNDRFIHPNGMTVSEGRINLLINNLVNDSAGSIPEFCPSGIWEYDEVTGSLYHKYSLSLSPVGTTTVYDAGQNKISGVGALSDMKISNTTSGYNGSLIAGAVIFTDSTTTDAGVFINDTLDGSSDIQKTGYIVTTKYISQQIQDACRKVFIKHKQLIDASDKIVVKYRMTEVDPTYFTLTWTSGTTFTTTTDIRSYFDYVNNVNNGEVEILQGTGSGFCAHITKIDVTSGTYTVTLDETISGVTTGTAKARVQNWTKVSKTLTYVATNAPHSYEFPIGKTNEWIQLKVYFIFKDRDEIEELLMINSTHQNAA